MSELSELLGTLRAFAIPMRTRFRGITVREGALIQGPSGWGEFSPFAGYGPAESARWLASAIESATVPWPAPLRDSVPVNVTVPAVGPARAYEIVAASGCRTAKVKVAERGQAPGEDIDRVAAVRDALDAAGPGGRIRVDANGGWTVDQAARMLRAIGKYGLEYAEQPCATLGELASLRRRLDIPVAADESIRKAEDPLRVRAGRRGRHRHGQGAAPRRCRRRPAGSRGLRAAGRRLKRGRHVGRAGRRDRARRSAARVAVRVRAGDDVPAGRRRHRRTPGRGRGRDRCPPPRGRPRRPRAVGDRPGTVAPAGAGGRASPGGRTVRSRAARRAAAPTRHLPDAVDNSKKRLSAWGRGGR